MSKQSIDEPAPRRPLGLDEWQQRTGTSNRALARLTREIDPQREEWEALGCPKPVPRIGVAESTIRSFKAGEPITLRVAWLLVEASRRRPAIINGRKRSIWWEALRT